MKTRTIYECCFDLGDKVRMINISNDENMAGLLVFIHGFWLDQDSELVHDEMEDYRARQYMWIPPHRIRFITKKTYELEEE